MGKRFLKLACLVAIFAIVAFGFLSVEAESEEEGDCIENYDCEEYENSQYDCEGECVEYHCDDGVCYCECVSPDRKFEQHVYVGNRDAAAALHKLQNHTKRP